MNYDSLGVPYYKVGDNWRTPATDYPIGRVGKATITRFKYKRGLYLMEGVDGYPVFAVNKAIPVTELRIDGNIWMVDDPLHWVGMQRLGAAAQGHVLVVGLGLGLVIWGLTMNDKVREVTVIDNNPDVIRLIKPRIRGVSGGTDDRYWLHIREKNFWNLTTTHQYDTIILDIWTTSVHDAQEVTIGMLKAELMLQEQGFGGKLFVWGSRNPKYNPSVKPMSKRAEEFLDLIHKEWQP